MGIGDWGLGIGPNPQSPIPKIPNPQSPIPNPPNPQSPIPNPQSPIPNPHLIFNYLIFSNAFIKIINSNYYLF